MSARRVPLGRSKRVSLAVDRRGDHGAAVGHLDDVAGALADVEEHRILVPGAGVHDWHLRGVLVAEDGEVAAEEQAELVALGRDRGLMHQIARFDPVFAQRGVVGAHVDRLAAGAPDDVERVDVADADLARVPGPVRIAGGDLGLGLGLGADRARAGRARASRGGGAVAGEGRERRGFTHGRLASRDDDDEHRGDGAGDHDRGAREGG